MLSAHPCREPASESAHTRRGRHCTAGGRGQQSTQPHLRHVQAPVAALRGTRMEQRAPLLGGEAERAGAAIRWPPEVPSSLNHSVRCDGDPPLPTRLGTYVQ